MSQAAADHLAEAALQSPDASAGADIDIVQTLSGQFLSAANVVDVVGVAAVDDDVARLRSGSKAQRVWRQRPPRESSARPRAAAVELSTELVDR